MSELILLAGGFACLVACVSVFVTALHQGNISAHAHHQAQLQLHLSKQLAGIQQTLEAILEAQRNK